MSIGIRDVKKKKNVNLQELSIEMKIIQELLNEEDKKEFVDYKIYNEFKRNFDRNFSIVFSKLKNGLLKYINEILKHKGIKNGKVSDYSNDILSEVFLNVYTKILQFNEMYTISTWIYAITKNETLKYINNEQKKGGEVCFTDFLSGNSNANEKNETYSDDENLTSILINVKRNTSYYTDDYQTFSEIEETEEFKSNFLLQEKYNLALECIEELPDGHKDIIKDKYINRIRQVDLERIYDINLNTIKTRDRKAKSDLVYLYKIRKEKVLKEYESGLFVTEH